MRPDFGCGIHDLVFEVINTTTLTDIEESVREALALFESRIEVQQVKALTDAAASTARCASRSTTTCEARTTS